MYKSGGLRGWTRDGWLNSQYTTYKKGRISSNSTRNAELDRMGKFMSSDGFYVLASDFGPGIRRRLTVDYDGNLRISRFHKSDGTWKVSWEALIYFARQDLISFILLLIRRRVTIGTPFWLELTRGFASQKKIKTINSWNQSRYSAVKKRSGVAFKALILKKFTWVPLECLQP